MTLLAKDLTMMPTIPPKRVCAACGVDAVAYSGQWHAHPLVGTYFCWKCVQAKKCPCFLKAVTR